MSAVGSVRSEWLKQRNSLASWMVLAGAVFTPAIILVARLLNPQALPRLYAQDGFWLRHWNSAWESVAIFLLPMGAVFATSFIAQIEVRNNAWKQVRTLPLASGTLYFAKLGVILLMLAQFLVLFAICLCVSVLIPPLLMPGVPFPAGPLPGAAFLRDLVAYFIDCLPIVALQYLLSVHYRNFMVPIGAGFMLWVGTLAALPWRWGYLVPYSYSSYDYLLRQAPTPKMAIPGIDIHVMALAYFAAFTLLGYVLFATKAEKG